MCPEVTLCGQQDIRIQGLTPQFGTNQPFFFFFFPGSYSELFMSNRSPSCAGDSKFFHDDPRVNDSFSRESWLVRSHSFIVIYIKWMEQRLVHNTK